MKVAVIGSRDISIENLEKYLPDNVTEIVSGGAKGVDQSAKEYANKNDIALKEFLPEYEKYGRRAPLVRNDLIVDYADVVLAFWNGKSTGTKYVIEKCKAKNKKVRIFIPASKV